MLTHPTFDQLNALGLQGMARAFGELIENPEAAGLGHADWLALLLDRETVHRQDKRLGARLRHARLRHHAVPEDIDYRAHRGLDRGVLMTLLNVKLHRSGPPYFHPRGTPLRGGFSRAAA